MATEATLRHPRVHRLIEQHAGSSHVHLQACRGLAAAIERSALDDPSLIALVQRHCRDVAAAGVDAVALGCTHYPLVRRHIEAALGPGVRIVDTSAAVARRVVELCQVNAPAPARGPVRLRTTGDIDTLRRMADHWLPFACTVGAAPAMLALN
jgi:glutamate racemase